MDAETSDGPMGYLARHRTTDFTERYDSVSAISQLFNEASGNGMLRGVPILKLRAQERFATHKVSNLSDWAAKGSYLAKIMVDELKLSPWSGTLGVQASLAIAGTRDIPAISLQAADASAPWLRRSQRFQQLQQQQQRQRRKGGEPQAIVPTRLR